MTWGTFVRNAVSGLGADAGIATPTNPEYSGGSKTSVKKVAPAPKAPKTVAAAPKAEPKPKAEKTVATTKDDLKKLQDKPNGGKKK